ncbi:hypothetical protein K8T06_12955, partial [bacterium]|nr:hypothetical protein [bacterium]
GAICAVSFLIPIITTLVWLAANSALNPFMNIFFNYLPLHSMMTQWHANIPRFNYLLYLIESTFKFGGYGVLFLCSLFAYYRVSTNPDRDKATIMSLVCLFLCTGIYAFYPTIAGMFWDYHYMPFAYFCALSAALCFYTWPEKQNSSSLAQLQTSLTIVILIVAVTVQLNIPRYITSTLYYLQPGSEVQAPNGGRVDEIANWLKERLHPDDLVQPLDWAGGSVHGMLLAEARLATHFIHDYHFYHNISSPIIQKLRRSFISQLHETSPRFIIEVHTRTLWVSGIDSTREFPELRKFLRDSYKVVHKGKGYFIYERKNGLLLKGF